LKEDSVEFVSQVVVIVFVLRILHQKMEEEEMIIDLVWINKSYIIVPFGFKAKYIENIGWIFEKKCTYN